MFVHVPVQLEDISNQDTDIGRFYTTPGGIFPSVTTVIGAYKGTASLVKWRERVGEKEANSVQKRAQIRGRLVHQLAENYLKNDPDWKAGAMPAHLDSFLSVKKILDTYVGQVFGVEVPLWSKILRTAGRTDLLAEWNGVPSVIDFKTSLRPKDEEAIWGYFIQKSCYGEMVEELTDLRVPQIVTVMMVDHDDPLIWVKRRQDYVDDVYRVFRDAPRPQAWEEMTSTSQA